MRENEAVTVASLIHPVLMTGDIVKAILALQVNSPPFQSASVNLQCRVALHGAREPERGADFVSYSVLVLP